MPPNRDFGGLGGGSGGGKTGQKFLSQKEAGQEPAVGSDPGAKVDKVGSEVGSACGNL